MLPAVSRPPYPACLLLVALCGCSASAIQTQEGRTQLTLDQLDGAAPDAIGVRALWIAHAGAEGAKPDVTRTEAQAKKRAELLAGSARGGGEKFQDLVRKYSDQEPLARRGTIGAKLERGNGLLATQLEDIAFDLPIGGVSAPLKQPQGFVVLARTDDPSTEVLTQVAARHILISHEGARGAAAEQKRTKDEARALAERLRDQLRNNPGTWNETADTYSDEPSKRPGGDLGLFGRGEMVPAFERTAFALDVGEISDVVNTPFGFHVITRYR